MLDPWTPKNATTVVRYYVSGHPDTYFEKDRKRNRVVLRCEDSVVKSQIRQNMASVGVSAEEFSSLTEFGVVVEQKGLVNQKRSVKKRSFGKNSFGSNNDFLSMVNKKSQKALYQESLTLDCAKTPFSKTSINNLHIAVDHREPDQLAIELNKSDIAVSVGHLDDGDVLVTDTTNPKRKLLIERKRITDFTQDIIGDEKRAYKQMERYYALQQDALENNVELRVVWIIEGEDGVRGFHNTLPTLPQIIGWTNYFTGVTGTHFVESYSTTMSAYLTLKIAQGFFEQELPYTIIVDDTRIDRNGNERSRMTKRITSAGDYK